MKSFRASYALASAAAIVAALFPFYVELAVGVIDPPGGPVILFQLGVLAVGLLAMVQSQFEAEGMARALLAAAVAQGLLGVIALMVVPAHPASPALEVLGVYGLFVTLFLGSAWLFRRAARHRESRWA